MTKPTSACRVTLATPDHPGAVAVIHIDGDVVPVLAKVGARPAPAPGRLVLRTVSGVDDVLVARIGERAALVMPAGGPHVVRRILQGLRSAGAEMVTSDAFTPRDQFPEADDDVEALALQAVARASSPLAIDLLLRQPQILRGTSYATDEDRERSLRLSRLLTAPLVVLAGPPNSGKSTLTNRLAGRAVSITADHPGTTRDAVAVRLDLGGLVVNWIDTPGVRVARDPIEQRSISLVQRLFEGADLILAMKGPDQDWPVVPRPPHLRIGNKRDLGPCPDADIGISALTGDGVEEFVRRVRDLLVAPADIASERPWLFDPSVLDSRRREKSKKSARA